MHAPNFRTLRPRSCVLALTLLWPVAGRATPAAFDLNEIRVEGSSVLPQETVEQTIYPFLGPGRTAADVDHARAALQTAYQQAGYVTVSVVVPQQSLQVIKDNGGVVIVQVIERRVERQRVVGAKYFLPDAVRAGSKSLSPGTVPNMHKVTADLLALNRFPDRSVQPSLRAGRTPDTVDVDMNVTDNLPLHGTIELNNRSNADTTRLRLDASLTYNNLFQRGDSVTLSYQVAPENVADAEVTAASYLFRIPNSVASLLFSYLHSNSNVDALGVTDVVGRGTSAGFRLLLPLGSTADFSHSLSVGWDYKRYFELDNFLSTKQLTSAPITYYPLVANYAANWSGKHSSIDLTIGAEFSLAGLGSGRDAFYNKAADAPPGFAVLRSSVTREQYLPHDVQLWGQVSGQLTNQPLISSEQIGAGGVDSVRGYLEAEDLGDYGATLQTELRSPSLAKYIGKPLNSWRFLIFYDAGEVTLVRPSMHSPSTYGLSSVGIGTRVNLWGNLDATLQDAFTLNTGTTTHAGTNRVLFRVSGEF